MHVIKKNGNTTKIYYSLDPYDCYIPDNAILQCIPKLPKRTAHLPRIFTRSYEYTILSNLVNWFKSDISYPTGMSVRTLLKTDRTARNKYFGAKSISHKIINGIIYKELKKANPEALRVARRFANKAIVYKQCIKSIRRSQIFETFPALAWCCSQTANVSEFWNMVDEGIKLKEIVNKTSALPLWFRKIHPKNVHLFDYCLINTKWHIDQPTLDFLNRVKDFIPLKAMEQYRWLRSIFKMPRVANYSFRIWATKKIDWSKTFNELVNLHDLKDYATSQELYGVKPFSPEMSVQKVIELSQEWHHVFRNQRLLLANKSFKKQYEKKAAEIYPEPPIPGSKYKEWEIIPIQNYKELVKESEKMHHCVSNYHKQIVNKSSYIYSIRHNEKEMATLELSYDNLELGNNIIKQLRGPCNSVVPDEITKLVNRWKAEKNKKKEQVHV